MGLEIRSIVAGELEHAEAISAHAFNDRRPLPELVERAQQLFALDWCLAAIDDGEMTSMMRVLPAQMRINGGALSLGAVSPVANSPFHRRKGHTALLLRKSLEVMRERGQVLSGLYTPHPAFYRRYGWEVAGDGRRYEFKPKDLRLTTQPRDRGTLRPVTDWQELDHVFQQATRLSNGPFVRDDFWWNKWIFGPHLPQPVEPVLWKDSSGSPQGYLLFIPGNTPEGWAGRIRALELMTLTGDAHLNLLAFLGSMDIYSEIMLQAPSDDPLPLLFSDGERLKVEQRNSMMLRVVDLEAALLSRPTVDVSEDVEFRIQVQDSCAPWNEGTWRIATKDGAVQLEKRSDDAGLSLEARMLGPILNGYISPSKAALAGLLEASDKNALVSADKFFKASSRPHFTDSF